MKKLLHILTFVSLISLLSACGGFKTDDVFDSFQAKATAYYPSDEGIEGGFLDRKGAKLNTLQAYLRGEVPYASVAMDINAFPYGTKIRILELEQLYGQVIEFRVVDTGGAFRGKGTSRIDICVENNKEAHKEQYNGTVTIQLF